MSIHYLSNHLSREEKAILFMSIDFYISRDISQDKASSLRSVSAELFKKHPSIDFKLYPLLRDIVCNFYKNLKTEGAEHRFQAKEYFIYVDLLNKTENLIEKIIKMHPDKNKICVK